MIRNDALSVAIDAGENPYLMGPYAPVDTEITAGDHRDGGGSHRDGGGSGGNGSAGALLIAALLDGLASCAGLSGEARRAKTDAASGTLLPQRANELQQRRFQRRTRTLDADV